VSIGVATLGTHAKSPTGLVMQADRALYDAKRAGRNVVKVAVDYVDETQPVLALSSGRFPNLGG
jgi:predicted signal transduction protein with EAL and GGDEF domain